MKIKEGYCPRCHAECTLYNVETSKGRMWLCYICAVNLGLHYQFRKLCNPSDIDIWMQSIMSEEAANHAEKYGSDIDDGAVRDEI